MPTTKVRRSLLGGKSLGKDLHQLQTDTILQNDKCMNCRTPHPDHICLDFRTFVCQQCSDIHGEFGHRTVSIDHHEWTQEQVDEISFHGCNATVAEDYLAFWDPESFKPPTVTEPARIRDFIRKAYVIKCWRKQPDFNLERSGERCKLTPAVVVEDVNQTAENTTSAGSVLSFANFDGNCGDSADQNFDPNAKLAGSSNTANAKSSESADSTWARGVIDESIQMPWQASFSPDMDVKVANALSQKADGSHLDAATATTVEDLISFDIAPQAPQEVSQRDCFDVFAQCNGSQTLQTKGTEMSSLRNEMCSPEASVSSGAASQHACHAPLVNSDTLANLDSLSALVQSDQQCLQFDDRAETRKATDPLADNRIQISGSSAADRFAALDELKNSKIAESDILTNQSSAFGDLLISFNEKHAPL